MNRSAYIENKKPDMSITFDGDFHWKNVMNSSFCHLKVYKFGRHQIAVATEPEVNTGASITNGAEALWTGVKARFGECYFFETYNGIHFDAIFVADGKATFESIGSWDNVLRSV